MISSKRFLLIFASIFALASVPLLLGQPSGASSAGLSAGFMMPIEQLWQLMIFVALGVYAAHLRSSHAMILLPLSFLLLFVVGMSIELDMTRYNRMPFFLLGAVLLFALCFTIARSQPVLLGMVIAASLGFHFGNYYYRLIPDIAAPLYFLIGNLLALALIFCASVSLGLTFIRQNRRQERERQEQKVKPIP